MKFFDKMDINFALVDVEAICQIMNMKRPQLYVISFSIYI